MTTDSSDKLFQARIHDLIRKCDKYCCPVYSQFLDERQCAEAELICRGYEGLRYMLWGGFNEAQRKMLCIYDCFSEVCNINDFPMRCLTFSFRKENSLSHRDFLGSFMGLRLKRDTIGDIITDDGIAQAFVTDVAAKTIITDIAKIGRTGVKIRDDMPFSMNVQQSFEKLSCTVASLRLDCVVSAAARISRENAARFIRNEKVNVNYLAVTSLSRSLIEGDVVTIRGYGKYVLKSIEGTTKKGRIHINLHKYK